MNKAEFVYLDNGLTILIYSDKSKISNHIELITFLGGKSRSYIDYDGVSNEIIPGSAHFLEHYVCERSINGNLIDNLKEIGVISSNASTNNFVTSFYADMVCNFESCLEMFLKCIYNPVFNDDNVLDTKHAVLNEIRDDDDNFRRKISYRIVSNVFYNNVRTLGDTDSVNMIDANYLKKLYECTYTPSNQLLVLAGCFDYDDTLKYVREFYDNISFKCNRRLLLEKEKSSVVLKRDVFVCDIMEEIIISFKIDVSNLNNFDKYRLDWYLGAFSLINFSKYSSISDYIRSDSSYTGDISFSQGNFGDYVLFEIAVYTNKYEEFKNLVLSNINNFRDNTREEFEYYKKHCKTKVSVRKDNISSYIIPIIQNYTDFNYPYDDTMDFIDSLNYDDYIEMIGNLDFSNYSYLCVKRK